MKLIIIKVNSYSNWVSNKLRALIKLVKNYLIKKGKLICIKAILNYLINNNNKIWIP